MSEEKKTPAKKTQPGKAAKILNWFKTLPQRIVKPFRNMYYELKKVSWPSKQRLISYSIIVLAFMLVMGVLIGLLDMGASAGVRSLISAPAAEAPATDAPATEEAATDAPATDAPATEETATDAPATDAPATEEAATDAPATDAPATEEAATDAPATDAPAEDAGETETADTAEGK